MLISTDKLIIIGYKQGLYLPIFFDRMYALFLTKQYINGIIICAMGKMYVFILTLILLAPTVVMTN
jgi:hypothetical protein